MTRHLITEAEAPAMILAESRANCADRLRARAEG